MKTRKGIHEDRRIEDRSSHPGSTALEENPRLDPRIPHERNPTPKEKD